MVKLLNLMNAKLRVSSVPPLEPARSEGETLSVRELQSLFVRELYGRHQGKGDM
ncbi:MAG: hypothetical protein HKN30_15540 [Sulfitobacter sp.]|nr:hypothetical protein [Sulfitobacter sp.]